MTGQEAYAVWLARVSWEESYPKWEDLPFDVRAAWDCVADAAEDSGTDIRGVA